jgi:hypothetical protein
VVGLAVGIDPAYDPALAGLLSCSSHAGRTTFL